MNAFENDITVTIVEDNDSLRSIYADWIENADGFTLLSQYRDGQVAYDSIPAENPDVVLTDINLPGMDGVECVRSLKPKLPNTQFVIITAYEDAKRVFSALEAGATGYFLKQTPRDQLLASLRDIYQGGSPMSSGIARKVVQCTMRSNSTDSNAGLNQLSKRETQVLDLLVQGYFCREIASELDISTNTVETYQRRIYEKLQVNSRAQATALYQQPDHTKSSKNVSKPKGKDSDHTLNQLSKREKQVLDLLAHGSFCKDIASELDISINTLDTYLRRIYEKLHVKTRAQATARYNELKPPDAQTPENH